MDPKKITLHFISRNHEILRVTTFGAQSIAESTIKTYDEFPVHWDLLKSKSAEMLGLLRRAADQGYGAGDFRSLDALRDLLAAVFSDSFDDH